MHQKHTQLTRPGWGNFGRNEVAIVGTPCGEIQRLARGLISSLKDYRVAYVDADHKSADEEAEKGKDIRSALAHGAAMEFTDKITFSRFDFGRSFNSFEQKPFFNAQDLVLVNGNHFHARQQIVVLDPRKEASLKKRLSQLTDVRLFLLQEGVGEMPDFVKEALPHWNQIPVLPFSAGEAIASLVRMWMEEALPPVKGLVLVGGKSQRMGKDKALLSYHGKPQHLHLAETLTGLGLETFYSGRPGQGESLEGGFPVIPDTFTDLGPFGGILSAFREDPNAAWLVAAVDLPLLDRDTLQFLLDHRDSSRIATAFQSPQNEFPEPLITIWEPRSYPVLLHFLSLGYSCPRKALINSDVALLQAPDARALTNVNTPEEYERVREQVESSK